MVSIAYLGEWRRVGAEMDPEAMNGVPSLSAVDATGAGLDPALQQVLERIRLRARRRAAWLRHLWSNEGEPGGAWTVTHAEIDAHLADCDDPEAEAAWFARERSVGKWNQELEAVEAAMAADTESRLALFNNIFGLDRQEADVFQACLAVELDPPLARVFAYLQDQAARSYVTEALVARLYGHGRSCLLSPQSPLFRWELVSATEVAPGESPMLTCDRLVCRWLLGYHDLDEQLIGIAAWRLSLPALDNWPVRKMAQWIATYLDSPDAVERVRVCISGPPGSGRRTLAACISAKLGMPLLAVDADQIAEQAWPRVFVRAQRQAYLERCTVAWHGEGILRRAWPQIVAPFPVQFVICEPGQELAPLPGNVDERIEMPSLSLDERRRLWSTYMPASAAWPAQEFSALVRHHRATVGEIAAIARYGVSGPAKAADLVRSAQRYRLGRLAQPLESPFVWDDLEVTRALREALEDLEFEAQERVAFWEAAANRKLFPQGRGVLALFSGPPGTGKTMAAQVIAHNLGVDLFRIDLSAVVSKYVGETSQNLERILSRAEQMDVVLLFDEADALFGKRTEIQDAHDRFANTDTGYLLQAIESYDGIAILATNKKGNIDPAFIRRIRYVLEFPKPDAAQRLAIWRRIVGKLVPESVAALDGDLERLAAALDVTGAQIKFAILAALFMAQQKGQPLNLSHLLRGLDRELMKEGRSLGEREREKLLKHDR